MKDKRPTIVEIRAAEVRAEKRARIEPRAEYVTYQPLTSSIKIGLRDDVTLEIPVWMISELAGATPEQLMQMRAGMNGEALTVEEIDVDVSIPGLLRDLVGVTAAAAALGRKGGSARSEAKAAAVRENGKRGGRPRKAPQPA